MSELTFVTGNIDKFTTGLHVAQKYGVVLLQASPDIDEIQSENAEYIARKKAQAAYDLLQKPVIITDDSWAIPGLNGFPGAYMKSMNHWLTVDDFLRLTTPLTDRSCIVSQILVYQDELQQIVFTNQVTGHILTESRGDSEIPWANLAVLDGDNGMSIAEVRASTVDRSNRDAAIVWREFFDWYREHKS